MRIRSARIFTVFLFLSAFPSSVAAADSVAGFDFSLSPERAFERAAELGLAPVDRGRGKDGRRVAVFGGAAPGVPFGPGARTRLVFFKNGIETATLVRSDADDADALAVEEFVVARHGPPSADETVFSYTVKSWNLPDSRVVLSYSRGGVLKLDHIHLPTRRERRERDFRRKKTEGERSPVQRMLDGDYSNPELYR